MELKKFIMLICCALMFVAPLSGCKKKEYSRKAELVELGEIRNFLESRQFIAHDSLMILRDARGWSALNTRCTKEGCDLTPQENSLFCSCCGSSFDFSGRILRGPAKKPLPFYEIFFKDRSLFAEVGKQVQPDFHFTTEAIERAIAEYQKLKAEQPAVGSSIPELLHGAGDGEKGDMFVETPENQAPVVEDQVSAPPQTEQVK